jgi:hypothetical protein
MNRSLPVLCTFILAGCASNQPSPRNDNEVIGALEEPAPTPKISPAATSTTAPRAPASTPSSASSTAATSTAASKRTARQDQIIKLLARGDYEEVLKLDPENFTALSHLFEENMLAGDDALALDYFQRLKLRDNGIGPGFLYYPLAAVSFERTGKPSDAAALIESLETRLKKDLAAGRGFFSRSFTLGQAAHYLRLAEKLIKTPSLKQRISEIRMFAEQSAENLSK